MRRCNNVHPCRDKAHQLLNLPPSPDLPTYGQPSCIHCHLFLFIDSQHFCYAFNSNLQIHIHHPTDGTIDMNVTMMANCSLPYHLHLMSSGLVTVSVVVLQKGLSEGLPGPSAGHKGRTVGREEAPKHFFRRTAITSPHCQEFMV